jgi:LysR family transcriptional regulator, regulator of abg operon
VLHSHALKVLHELNAATDQIKQLSGSMAGELSVAAVPLAVMLLIPETLRTFSREFPHIRLRVSEELYMAQLPRLRAGAIDIAIGGIPVDLANGEFTIEHLMNTQMVPVVNRSSQRVKSKTLTDLLDARWVYTGATSVEGYAKQLFETHGLPQPAIGAVVNSTLALLSLITSGDFVGLMPIQIAQHPLVAPHLQIIPIREEGLPLNVGAMICKDISVAPSVRHFLAHLHRAAN